MADDDDGHSEPDGGGDQEEEEYQLVLSRPSKRRKLMNDIITGSTTLLLRPTKLCQWVLHKFIRPSSSSSSSSSSELIPFPSASGPDNDDFAMSKYFDVFISFRGGDVRNQFLSHLYTYLNDYKKLLTYKDDVDLQRGMQISPSHLRAIEKSGVYIVILSSNYAGSPWCLEELEKILQCKAQYRRRVIPVFYGVDPSNVENQKLPSAVASTRKVQSWRAALREIANISGFDSQVIRPETKLIEEIAKAAFQALRGQMVKVSSYSTSRCLVGVDRKLKQLETLLCSRGRGNRTIGLWGMAGIGKTILAKALFDQFSSQFEASYFLDKFADRLITSGQQSCGDLQNYLFSKLLGHRNGNEVGGALSYDMRLHRLGRTRSLVVIDDVGNDVGHIRLLNDLLNGQYCDLFGPGSIIILTSRNKQLLNSVCDNVYDVKPLDYEEASRLFCMHAFKGDSVQAGYVEMVSRATHYADGNPLAVIVLGTHLYGRDLKFWNRELDALQENPNPVLQSVLRKSYDGLSRTEKDAFLDIACFYRYWHFLRLEKIEAMLWDGERGNLITNLIDKSLVSILAFEDRSHIQINALLRDLGCSIVNEERQVGKRSRLWMTKDIKDLFKQNKGTDSVEGIYWDYRGGMLFTGEKVKIPFQADAFLKMENLRFLVIQFGDCVVLPEEGLKYLPNALRILEWYMFPSKFLPSQFSAENLVCLTLYSSKLEQLWDADVAYNDVNLGNLKFLNLDGSKYLKKLPDLSTAKRLKEIYVRTCLSLVELPLSILDLPKLEILDVSYCYYLDLNNLENYADSRQDESYSSPILPNLKNLVLSGTRIQKVPSFITRLKILELYCESCREMTEFPIIASLQKLWLSYSVIKEVNRLKEMRELKELILSDNQHLTHVSEDICKLQCVGKIDMSRCSQLEEFPDILETMEALVELNLSGCSSLSSLPDSISNLVNLKALDLNYASAITKLPSSIGDLTCLSLLRLKSCKSLSCLPDTINKLSKLGSLYLSGCYQLSHLPELPSSLHVLNAFGCLALQNLSIVIEKHDLSRSTWNFGRCRKLDWNQCRKLVDKFTLDIQQPAIRYHDPCLVLPAKFDTGEGSHSTVTVKLRDIWKLEKLIYCVVLESYATHSNKRTGNEGGSSYGKYAYTVQCFLVNNIDVRKEVVVSAQLYHWHRGPERDDHVNLDHHRDLLMWHGDIRSWRSQVTEHFFQEITDGHGTITFFFRVLKKKMGSRVPAYLPNLIKTCGVIPVYNNRVVKEEDDDKSLQQGTKLLELFDSTQMTPPLP